MLGEGAEACVQNHEDSAVFMIVSIHDCECAAKIKAEKNHFFNMDFKPIKTVMRSGKGNPTTTRKNESPKYADSGLKT